MSLFKYLGLCLKLWCMRARNLLEWKTFSPDLFATSPKFPQVLHPSEIILKNVTPKSLLQTNKQTRGRNWRQSKRDERWHLSCELGEHQLVSVIQHVRSYYRAGAAMLSPSKARTHTNTHVAYAHELSTAALSRSCLSYSSQDQKWSAVSEPLYQQVPRQQTWARR